jgi:hypothetical protein
LIRDVRDRIQACIDRESRGKEGGDRDHGETDCPEHEPRG